MTFDLKDRITEKKSIYDEFRAWLLSKNIPSEKMVSHLEGVDFFVKQGLLDLDNSNPSYLEIVLQIPATEIQFGHLKGLQKWFEFLGIDWEEEVEKDRYAARKRRKKRGPNLMVTRQQKKEAALILSVFVVITILESFVFTSGLFTNIVDISLFIIVTVVPVLIWIYSKIRKLIRSRSHPYANPTVAR